jgi:hypothetical protein
MGKFSSVFHGASTPAAIGSPHRRLEAEIGRAGPDTEETKEAGDVSAGAGVAREVEAAFGISADPRRFLPGLARNCPEACEFQPGIMN